MEKNVPTIYKTQLQIAQMLGKQHTVLPNTTLNQKLNIQAAATLNPADRHKLGLMVLGNGGLSIQTGADGYVYTDSYVHKVSESGAFNEIPFLVRPINSDIGDIQRANYRLRKMITVGGESYIAYYAKVLDLSAVTISLEQRQVQPDGSFSVTPFVPGSQHLNPTPTILSSGQTVVTGGTYIAAVAKVPFVLSPQDVLELLNASQLLFGNENHASFSEMMLCAGVDRQVTVTTGTQVTYIESVATQIMSFLATNFPTPSMSQGNTWMFDVGNAETLLSVS